MFELVIERRRGHHAQREMPGNQRGTPAIGRNQVAIRQPAVPHAQGALLGVDIQQRGAAEHLHREDLFELGIDLAKDVGAGIALGGHAVEGFGQRHRADRCRQAMAGEIAEQHEHLPSRRVGRQQKIAVEQRLRGLPVADVRRTQATGVSDLVEDRLGRTMLVEQLLVAPGDQIALLEHRGLQTAQAMHGLDLGFEDDGVVRLGDEIVTTRLQAADQCLVLAERGEKDDRDQFVTGQPLDLPRRLEAVHHRHQGVHQHQLRTLLLEQGHRFLPIGSGEHPVPLLADNGGQQHPIDRAVLGDQDRQPHGHVRRSRTVVRSWKPRGSCVRPGCS